MKILVKSKKQEFHTKHGKIESNDIRRRKRNARKEEFLWELNK